MSAWIPDRVTALAAAQPAWRRSKPQLKQWCASVPQFSSRLIKSCKIEAPPQFAIAVAPVTGLPGISGTGKISPWITAPLLNTRNPHLGRWGFFPGFFQQLSFEDLSSAQDAEAEQAAAQQQHGGGQGDGS